MGHGWLAISPSRAVAYTWVCPERLPRYCPTKLQQAVGGGSDSGSCSGLDEPLDAGFGELKHGEGGGAPRKGGEQPQEGCGQNSEMRGFLTWLDPGPDPPIRGTWRHPQTGHRTRGSRARDKGKGNLKGHGTRARDKGPCDDQPAS